MLPLAGAANEACSPHVLPPGKLPIPAWGICASRTLRGSQAQKMCKGMVVIMWPTNKRAGRECCLGRKGCLGRVCSKARSNRS